MTSGAGTDRALVEATGLVKHFERVRAVDGVDLRIGAGEILGLVGPNGAGKTTLISMLCGILVPSEGTITIAGHGMADDGVAARGALAFVPDTPTLFESLTVLEHMEFVAQVYGVEDPGPRIAHLLEEFELADRADRVAANLSRGMRQKVAICCALVHDPSVLLLDEPLTGLDPIGRRRMVDRIVEHARSGAAVLVSSHQLEVVERVSDRFAILHRGRVVLEGVLAEILAELRAGTPDLGDGTLEEVFLRATDGSVP